MQVSDRSIPLPLDRLSYWAEREPNRIYLRQPVQGKVHEFDWKTVFHEARCVAAAIQRLGLPDKSPIAIFSKNCAHWLMADYAIWLSGHISVPLYPNLTGETVAFILKHSEAKLFFVGKLDNWQSIQPHVPSDLPLITFPYNVSATAMGWNDCVGMNPSLAQTIPRQPEELATIIYTSGTTGIQKGVMHSFHSIAFAASTMSRMVEITEKDRFISYLPLAHVAERLVTECVPLYCGATVSFVETLETFTRDMQNAAPTIFLGVPRIWTKFQAGVLAKFSPKKLARLLKLPLLGNFLKKSILKKLGLAHVRLALTGAAPVPLPLIEWFGNIGLEIREAYGLTENFAYSHFNLPAKSRRGSVGVAWPHVEVRISPEGEIQTRSPATMLGYFKNAEESSSAILEGYLRTGDKGSIDSDGFLWITGRVKEIFKTSKGKYVAPAPIEMKLLASSDIEQCCVVGSGLSQPIALIILSPTGKGKTRDSLQGELALHLQTINATLDSHERVQHLVIVANEWTPENGMLTPTLKIKRDRIDQTYSKYFETWSQASDRVIFQNPN